MSGYFSNRWKVGMIMKNNAVKSLCVLLMLGLLGGCSSTPGNTEPAAEPGDDKAEAAKLEDKGSLFEAYEGTAIIVQAYDGYWLLEYRVID